MISANPMKLLSVERYRKLFNNSLTLLNLTNLTKFYSVLNIVGNYLLKLQEIYK